MAPSLRPRVVTASLPPRFHLLIVGALAARLARNVDGARLEGLARSVAASVATHSTPGTVDKAQRERDLRLSAMYVDSVNLDYPMTLSNIRDILWRFEDLRSRVLSIGSIREARAKQEVRRVLGELRKKADVLNDMAAKKVEAGEIDDGGVLFPTQRDNICNNIDKYEVDADFAMEVKRMCEALDVLRETVMAGEDETQALFEVSGRLSGIREKPQYAIEDISWGVGAVLGEERRWVTKQLMERPPPPSDQGKLAPLPQTPETIAGKFSAWSADIIPSPQADPVIRQRGLTEAIAVVNRAQADENISLSLLRTTVQRLDFYKERLAEYILCSDPSFREQIREVLRLMKEKYAAIVAVIDKKELTGERDDGGDLPASQRENICKHIDTLALTREIHEEVKHICDSLDRMRKAVLDGRKERKDAALMEVVGRMHTLKSRPGYADLSIAGELEVVIAEECRWLNAHDHSDTLAD